MELKKALKLLNLTDNYTEAELKNAYRKLIIQYHPDKHEESKKEFDDKTYKYRELIDGLYRYALVRNKNAYIRALTENDYDEIIIEFDNIYNLPYFNLSLYVNS